jgi:hypothetical protein
MIRRFAVCFLLGCLLAAGAQADPITYQQVRQAQGPSAYVATPGSPVVRYDDPAQDPPPPAPEPASRPEFVRLPDGRIVPYGPGVICTENCVEPYDAVAPRSSRLWIAVPPVLAGGVVCVVLCGGGPVISGGAQPTPTPGAQPTPTPPQANIPEPATLILLGLGLAVLARRRLLEKLAHR